MSARKKAEFQRAAALRSCKKLLAPAKQVKASPGHRQAKTPGRDAMSKMEQRAADDYVRINPVF
jgi:hypothetical protein